MNIESIDEVIKNRQVKMRSLKELNLRKQQMNRDTYLRKTDRKQLVIRSTPFTQNEREVNIFTAKLHQDSLQFKIYLHKIFNDSDENKIDQKKLNEFIRNFSVSKYGKKGSKFRSINQKKFEYMSLSKSFGYRENNYQSYYKSDKNSSDLNKTNTNYNRIEDKYKFTNLKLQYSKKLQQILLSRSCQRSNLSPGTFSCSGSIYLSQNEQQSKEKSVDKIGTGLLREMESVQNEMHLNKQRYPPLQLYISEDLKNQVINKIKIGLKR